MKKIKIIIIFYYLMLPIYVSALTKDNPEIINIVIGKCKVIPQKKILEITSQNVSVLTIEKEILTNKICLKGKKIGKSKVSMLLYDGRGFVVWDVHVIQAVRKPKGRKKNVRSNYKISKFDKDLKISHKVSGWR